MSKSSNNGSNVSTSSRPARPSRPSLRPNCSPPCGLSFTETCRMREHPAIGELRAAGVVCFGGEDWWYHNRAHCDMQLMRQYARAARVLYVNSIVMRKPNIGEGRMFFRRLTRKLRSIGRGVTRVSDNFWVYSPVTAPVHHVPLARGLNQAALRMQIRVIAHRAGLTTPIVWVNCPVAADTALALRRCALVYQRTDRYEEYPGVDRDAVLRCDEMLKRRADLTFYSSRSLYEEERAACRRAAYVDHGVDYERFACGGGESPEELRDIPRPIAGFFGGMDAHTFDYPLMLDVVRHTPEVSFVFVGNSSIDRSELEACPNAFLIPQQPYERIPAFGRAFDTCLMPWNRNRWIAGCNPIKLKEYLALGKPIVSTPFPELNRYEGLVLTARDAAEFAAQVRRAVALDDPTLAERRRAAVQSSTWAAKADLILRMLAGEDDPADPTLPTPTGELSHA
ncbi:MAG: glycosyltransferase [Planctomycetota bacterium]|nr:MAG: glycosyltransferase [Planctomycetota bacterium]